MVKYNSDTNTGHLDRVFKALADSTRRDILEKLSQHDAQVTELAEPYAMSLPAISKHLNILEKAGLIQREKEGRVRRCVFNANGLKSAHNWMIYYQQFWEQRFGALDSYLNKTGEKHDN